MVEDIISTVEFQMSLLLFVSLTGYFLASKINQSSVIGNIIVGLIVGPSVLGLITYTDFVSALAHLGAVILLFVVGMEFTVDEIFDLKYGLIALFGVIVPWGAGYYLSGLYGYDFATSVFVGTALAATSIAITAEVLREMNMLSSPAAKAIIGAAVIDDILALLALSMSERLVHGGFSISSVFTSSIVALGFLVGGILLATKVISPYIASLDKSDISKRYPEFIFIFAMMVAFFYSMFAELIGLSAIVGAFIAGISLSDIKKLKHSRDFKEGAEYLHIIFASIFFVSLGVLANIHAMDARILGFMLILTIVAFITKILGCYIPAVIQGLSKKDSLIVSVGMIPRGEVAMIVALIGLNEGIFNQDVYVSLVLMALLTTIIPPISLRKMMIKKPAKT